MQLKKLAPSFYTDNSHLEQALDNFNGQWQVGKVRGYGVVIISINDLTFAIPLRSNIKHKASYITVKSQQKGIQGKGLDFSKALLISDDSYISNDIFKIPYNERSRLRNKETYITEIFENYVNDYIEAVNKQDLHILQSNEYRFTTLINYHKQLNI